MTAVCVDDESLILDYVVALCREIQIDARGFHRAEDALAWLKTNRADLAILDIDMPGMNGIELAAEIKKLHPDTAILFLTGFSEYALDAFSLRASGYLLKPVTREKLEAEVAYVLKNRPSVPTVHIQARTFGHFNLLVDGKTVLFKQAKCKELLAYLIDRNGGSVTRPEAFSVLWDDREYDRPMQKQFDAILRSLRDTLEESGAGEILEIKKGTLRIRPEKMTCDAWRFFSGDVEAINAYRGAYMTGYAWGSDTESYMNRKCRSD